MKRLPILLCLVGLANASLVLNNVPVVGTNLSLSGGLTASSVSSTKPEYRS